MTIFENKVNRTIAYVTIRGKSGLLTNTVSISAMDAEAGGVSLRIVPQKKTA